MFISGPDVVRAITGEEITQNCFADGHVYARIFWLPYSPVSPPDGPVPGAPGCPVTICSGVPPARLNQRAAFRDVFGITFLPPLTAGWLWALGPNAI